MTETVRPHVERVETHVHEHVKPHLDRLGSEVQGLVRTARAAVVAEAEDEVRGEIGEGESARRVSGEQSSQRPFDTLGGGLARAVVITLNPLDTGAGSGGATRPAEDGQQLADDRGGDCGEPRGGGEATGMDGQVTALMLGGGLPPADTCANRCADAPAIQPPARTAASTSQPQSFCASPPFIPEID